jgi:hypothetical protein
MGVDRDGVCSVAGTTTLDREWRMLCYNVESVDGILLLDDYRYYKHQCADNNNNVSGTNVHVFILPKGEIFIGISECSWQGCHSFFEL